MFNVFAHINVWVITKVLMKNNDIYNIYIIITLRRALNRIRFAGNAIG